MAHEGRNSIGKPYFNCRIYVLDQNSNPVPVGIIGELYIGGAGLARGYLNHPDLTSERFIANPFATEEDVAKGYTRLYRTGDMVRWLPDGNLEFLGRNDDQVKVRGYRIELGEVEHALSEIPGIKQGCVLARERETESGISKYLVGYYVVDSEKVDLSEGDIGERLSEKLPDYMVPTTLVSLESFPLTINGKLDKRALPDPEFSSSDEDYVAPVTETEVTLCKICAEVLGLDRVGVTDDFFRIGGDSILSIQTSNRIRQAGFNCQVKDIFQYKNILRLSQHLIDNDSETDILSEQGVLTGEVGLLPIQQWFTDRVEGGDFLSPNHWNQSFLMKVPALEEVKLVSVIEQLVAYHDVFRLRYRRGEAGWHQTYSSDVAIPALKSVDVSNHSAVELQEILTDWQSGFDLEEGPLFQVGYLYGYADGSARLYFAMHHLIVDGVSWRILSEDVKALYSGEELPVKGSSYRQWVDTVKVYPDKHWSESSYWSGQLSGHRSNGAVQRDETPSVATMKLNKKLTNSLLQHASQAYHREGLR